MRWKKRSQRPVPPLLQKPPHKLKAIRKETGNPVSFFCLNECLMTDVRIRILRLQRPN